MDKTANNLTRFVESASIDHRLLKKAENTEMRESLSRCPAKLRESHMSDSDGWWVPISFYNKKNGNGRIYNEALWDNVIDNQRETWVGAPMLADHPAGDSDGSPKDICGVWLDAKKDAPGADGIGLVYGLLMPSGTLGKDLKDHLSNGLKIGTSSSGFGKLMNDGCTVDPYSYTIERLSDWVLNPSQGTYFSYDESADDIENRSIRESSENKEKETVKEKTMKDPISKLTRLEEKVFRRNMEDFLESAAKIEDPRERLKEFNDIKSYLEDGACSDLKEKVEQKIAEEEAFIQQALKEKAEFKNELDIESPKDLKEKLTKIVEDYNVLDEESKGWKQISEKLQSKYTEVAKALKERPTNAYVSFLKEKNEKMAEELGDQSKKSEEIIKNLTESYKKIQEKCEAVSADLQEANTKKIALEEHVKKIDTLGRNVSVAKATLESKVADLEKALKEATEKSDSLTKIVEGQRTQIERLVEEKQTLKESLDKKTKQVKELMTETRKSQLKLAKVSNLIEAKSNALDGNAITDYYRSLCESYGSEMAEYKDTILNCMTLEEAKKVFYTKILQNLNESKEIEKSRIPENFYTSPSERASRINEKKFVKNTNPVDRLPKGWF